MPDDTAAANLAAPPRASARAHGPGQKLGAYPLGELQLSPFNPRTEATSEAAISALAESIAELGLQQNLIGYVRDGAAWIIGGGLRLRALQRLAADGRMSLDAAIPVILHASQDEALEAAIAENEARRAMGPADQYRAMRGMRDAGASLAHIAAACATDQAAVTRILILDRASNLVLQALAAGRLTLDQARAFTVARDTMIQNELLGRWAKLNEWQRDPDMIRRQLREMSGGQRLERKLKAVGREAYAEAGGELTTDLFSEQVTIETPGLVEQLFEARIEQMRQDLLDEGWSWAEFNPEADNEVFASRPDDLHLFPVGDEPTAEEAAFLERMEALEEADERPSDADAARLLELRARPAPGWTPDQLSVAGAVLYLNPHRGLLVLRGVLRAADAARAVELGVIGPDEAELEDEEAAAAPPAAGGLSEALRADLRSLRTVALANAVAAQPELALDILALIAAGSAHPRISGIQGSRGPLDGAAALGLGIGFDLVERPAWDEKSSLTLADIRALGREGRGDLLARWVAQSLEPPYGSAEDRFAPIEAAAGVSLRAVWTPGAAFLARLTMAQLEALWRELAGEEAKLEDWVDARRKHVAVDFLASVFTNPGRATMINGEIDLPSDFISRVNAWLPWPLRGGASDAP